ncbi:MAG: preprotein translocase subunit SecG [Planctomycetes bacterium]|nr:preprotein translocase subunit SecG [Planctomycetota bacterium]
MGVIIGLLWFVFVVACLLLGLIILIQEGKGGGLGEAFGGMGAETFGVKATGVNRVTAILAAVFVLSAVLINKCSLQGTYIYGPEPEQQTPAEGDSGSGGGAPEQGGGEDK